MTLRFGKGAIGDLTHAQFGAFSIRWRDPHLRGAYRTTAILKIGEEGKPLRLEMQMNRDRISAIRN